MPSYDSAWLLAELDRLAGRPDTDEITDAQKYQRLAQAQNEVIEDIAGIYPYALYVAAGPTALTAAAGRKTFTFGTDGQGHANAPLGHVAVFRNLADYPDHPLVEGVDYLDEGTQIRIPNNRAEASTLYWQGITVPTDISASQEPALRPASSRILIAIKAAKNFAEEGDQLPALADRLAGRYAGEFAKQMLAWKTRYRKGGALSMTSLQRGIVSSGGVL